MSIAKNHGRLEAEWCNQEECLPTTRYSLDALTGAKIFSTLNLVKSSVVCARLGLKWNPLSVTCYNPESCDWVMRSLISQGRKCYTVTAFTDLTLVEWLKNACFHLLRQADPFALLTGRKQLSTEKKNQTKQIDSHRSPNMVLIAIFLNQNQKAKKRSLVR